MADLELKVQKREKTGKGAARKYRAAGLIPAEYYSQHAGNVHLLLNAKEFETLIASARGVLALKVEGEKKVHRSVIKDIQFHPLTSKPVHVDFQGVKKGEKLTVTVPVVLKGTAAGVKVGGILEHMIRELQIECLPKDLPEQLELDISDMNVGDVLRVKDLQYENIRILDDPNEAIVMIEMSKVAEVAEGEEEELPEEEMAEPEVITAKKEEEE